MEEKIVYFDNSGSENTENVISLVLERAKVRNIKRIVVASTRGNTAQLFAEAVEGKDIELVVVPWQFGFKREGNPFSQKVVDELKEKNHQVHFGTMLFHTTELYGTETPQALANILRIFGQGMKVCIEIIMMACDGGCILSGEKVIAVAGTASGADTAVIVTASSSTSIKALHVHEIICKPELS